MLLFEISLLDIGYEIINRPGTIEFFMKFLLNFGVNLIVVRLLYYGNSRRKDYAFSYLIISMVVFLLSILLAKVNLQLGFALGLFAIFGIIRYRTIQIPIKEMTYLFLVIGISVINALTDPRSGLFEIIFANIALVCLTFTLERLWPVRHETSKNVVLKNIDLIKEGKRNDLIKNLEESTGIRKISRIEIGRVNFLKDTAKVRVFYYVKDDTVNAADLKGSTLNNEL